MSAKFTKGQRVQLDYNGQSIEALVTMASDNGRSLLLMFNGAFVTPSGGLQLKMMPLLMDDDGVYRDLTENAPATVTPVNDKKPAHH